ADVGAADRARRAAHEARWVLAVIARPRNEKTLMDLAFAHEARRAAVRTRAAAHAVVAPRARLEIDHEHAVRLCEPFRETEVEQVGAVQVRAPRRYFLDALAGDRPQALLQLRRALEHAQEVFARNAHELGVADRRRRHFPRRHLVDEQLGLADGRALTHVGDRDLAGANRLRHAQRARSHENEVLDRRSLARDDGAWLARYQLDVRGERVDQLGRKTLEDRCTAQMLSQRPLAIDLIHALFERLRLALEFSQRGQANLKQRTTGCGVCRDGLWPTVHRTDLAEHVARTNPQRLAGGEIEIFRRKRDAARGEDRAVRVTYLELEIDGAVQHIERNVEIRPRFEQRRLRLPGRDREIGT